MGSKFVLAVWILAIVDLAMMVLVAEAKKIGKYERAGHKLSKLGVPITVSYKCGVLIDCDVPKCKGYNCDESLYKNPVVRKQTETKKMKEERI